MPIYTCSMLAFENCACWCLPSAFLSRPQTIATANSSWVAATECHRWTGQCPRWRSLRYGVRWTVASTSGTEGIARGARCRGQWRKRGDDPKILGRRIEAAESAPCQHSPRLWYVSIAEWSAGVGDGENGDDLRKILHKDEYSSFRRSEDLLWHFSRSCSHSCPWSDPQRSHHAQCAPVWG